MLISLHDLVTAYHITFKGILHVGAHECEEITDYERYIDRSSILWIEAIPEKVEWCKKEYPNLLIENAIVSDKEEELTFNISNNGQSSSILEFGSHRLYHPHVHYVDFITEKTQLLKDIVSKYPINYNFINLDIQGAELKALKGLGDALSQIDYIYTEVNQDYVYKNCALVTELDEYLAQFGFVRAETVWTPYRWGDAFYIKRALL